MHPRVIMTQTPQPLLSVCDTKSNTYGCKENEREAQRDRETERDVEVSGKNEDEQTVLRVARGNRNILPRLYVENRKIMAGIPSGSKGCNTTLLKIYKLEKIICGPRDRYTTRPRGKG